MTEAHSETNLPQPPANASPAPAAPAEYKVEIKAGLHAFGDGLLLFRPETGDDYEAALAFIRTMKVKTRGRQCTLTISRGRA